MKAKKKQKLISAKTNLTRKESNSYRRFEKYPQHEYLAKNFTLYT